MFKTKPIKTRTLGEYLSALREHLGLSVAEISKLAKIPPKYITNLEQGEYNKLPATVYVKGFLKTLSEFYRVDHRRLLDLFEQEKILSDHLATTPDPAESHLRVPRFVFSPRTLAVTGAALLGLASVGYLYFQLSSVRRPPALEIYSPRDNAELDTSFMVLAGRAEAGANVFLNNQPVAVESSGEFRENLSLAPGPNQIIVKAVNRFGKEAVKVRQIIVAEKQIAGVQIGPTSTPSIAESKEITLKLLIGPNSSWVSVEADSQDVFTGTMLPGSSRVIQGKFVRLSTTNAGSVRLNVDGKDLGVLGKDKESLKGIEFSK